MSGVVNQWKCHSEFWQKTRQLRFYIYVKTFYWMRHKKRSLVIGAVVACKRKGNAIEEGNTGQYFVPSLSPQRMSNFFYTKINNKLHCNLTVRNFRTCIPFCNGNTHENSCDSNWKVYVLLPIGIKCLERCVDLSFMSVHEVIWLTKTKTPSNLMKQVLKLITVIGKGWEKVKRICSWRF